MAPLPRCDRCNSHSTVVKNGMRHNKAGSKQMFWCKSCSHRFTPDDGFKRMRTPPRAIVAALMLHARGTSLRGIERYLRENYQVEVSNPAISNWIKRYSLSDDKGMT